MPMDFLSSIPLSERRMFQKKHLMTREGLNPTHLSEDRKIKLLCTMNIVEPYITDTSLFSYNHGMRGSQRTQS